MDLQAAWIWLFAGLGLVLCEFRVTGYVLLWFGIGAWFTALLSLLQLTHTLPAQLIAFSVLSAILVGAMRMRRSNLFVTRNPINS